MNAVEVSSRDTAVEEKVREIEENIGKIDEIKEDFSKMKDKVETMDEAIEKKILEKLETKYKKVWNRK